MFKNRLFLEMYILSYILFKHICAWGTKRSNIVINYKKNITEMQLISRFIAD